MTEKTIFEIPIYSMKENDFEERWEKKKRTFFHEYAERGHSYEDIQFHWKFLHLPRYIWKYNQIVGCIKVSVTQQDVIFDIYCPEEKIFYADSKRKHFMKSTNGTHFYVGNRTEAEIKKEIKELLISLEKNHIHKNRYVDYTIFNNTINFLNIKEIMGTI